VTLSKPAPNAADGPTGRRPQSFLGRVRRDLLVSLGVLTVLAWTLTLYQAQVMNMPMGIAVRGGITADGMSGMAMAGMSAGGWSFGGAVIFLAVWTVMMTAMMLPATAPMMLMFAAAQARRGHDVAIPTWIFIAGYVLVWAAIGLLVYVLVQAGSDAATSLGAATRARWAPLALGITLIVAGLYQFTPLKRVCLSHCRSPMAFVAQHWRDGRRGALEMGIRHGAYCLGCCWALFAVLVATGVMSMAWMLLLTLVVFVEKVLPMGQHTAAAIGVSFVAFGVAVASGATAMPGLA
jgi:predicted metal-binding membrane protein